jgi:hypothetical protein
MVDVNTVSTQLGSRTATEGIVRQARDPCGLSSQLGERRKHIRLGSAEMDVEPLSRFEAFPRGH